MAAKESGIHITEATGGIDTVELNVVNGLASLPETKRIVNVDDDVIDPGVVELAHLLEDLVHHLLGGLLPLTRRQIRETLGTKDGQPILFRTIQHPIVEFCVGRSLEVETEIEITVALLQIHDAIIMLAAEMLDMIELGFGIGSGNLKKTICLIEEVQHVMEPGNWGEVNSIGQKILRTEARQKVQVGRHTVAEHGREEPGDLGKVLLVPEWTVSVQWRGDDHLQGRSGTADKVDLILENAKNTLD